MPWKECSLMTQRREFIQFVDNDLRNVTMLCRRYGISRKTGYKWLNRFRAQGDEGLNEVPRRPRHSPLKTLPEMEQRVLDVRKKHPWCGRKIHGYLVNHGVQGVPAASTITAILHRNGCISPQASENSKHWHRFERESPNDLWQMDFKGHFATQSQRCHPLTILDDHSRFCLCLHACDNEKRPTVKNCLITIFRFYGLPWQINVDNGTPWGAECQSKYTQLSLWLIRYGIVVSYSAPRHPQTNGKDERFHRTLKAEVLQGRDFRNNHDVEKAFREWKPIYNFERPHDSLDSQVPGSRYQASSREFPETLPVIEYSPSDIIRRVDSNGQITFHNQKIRISKALKGSDVALRPTTEDGEFNVYYVRQKIKIIDLKE